jgi:hypothetical protein
VPSDFYTSSFKKSFEPGVGEIFANCEIIMALPIAPPIVAPETGPPGNIQHAKHHHPGEIIPSIGI